MKVTMLGSWDVRCGIADYTRRLVEALRDEIEVDVVPATFQACPRAVYTAMGSVLNGGDVAHVQHSYAIFGGMHPLRSGWGAMADEVRRPLLVTLHELDLQARGTYHLPAPAELAYKRWFNRSVFLHPAVGGWFVHSRELREGLLRLGAPEDRVIYRPIPVESAPGGNLDLRELRTRFRLEGKRPLVILGFLTRRKGYDLALAALRQLPEEFVLVAAGGEHAADRTGTEQWLREAAGEAGVAERLRITGFLPESDLDGVTALAEAVLAPFHEMSASASVSYALARRKAVIASDLPENRALGSVRCFSRGNVEALVSAIKEVTGSPMVKESLEQAAGDYAARHSFSALARLTRQLYEQLAGEPTFGSRR